MTFPESVASGFSNCLDFSGRASRSEYWWFALFAFFVLFVAELVDTIFLRSNALHWSVAVCLIIPRLALAVRRLHDTGRSGLWWLILLIPLIGWIIYMIWMCTKGTRGANRYGLAPG